MKTTPKHLQFRWIAAVVASLALFSFLGNHPLFSQTSPSDSLSIRKARLNWLQADLTLDNSAYAATRKAIDKQVRAGVKPSTLVQRYNLQGKEAYDARKIFRWAYAVYRQQKANPNTNALIEANTVLDNNLRPGAYDWVRLRFLIASLGRFQRGNDLIPVGRRLLKQKYDDEEVMFHFVRVLTLSEEKEDRRIALALARQQAQKYPKDVYWQWMVADATDLYLSYGGPLSYESNTKIVAEMEKTLRILPANHPHRKRLIKAIVIYQTHFDANGKRQNLSAEETNRAITNTKLK